MKIFFLIMLTVTTSTSFAQNYECGDMPFEMAENVKKAYLALTEIPNLFQGQNEECQFETTCFYGKNHVVLSLHPRYLRQHSYIFPAKGFNNDTVRTSGETMSIKTEGDKLKLDVDTYCAHYSGAAQSFEYSSSKDKAVLKLKYFDAGFVCAGFKFLKKSIRCESRY